MPGVVCILWPGMATLADRRIVARQAAGAGFMLVAVLGAWAVLGIRSDPDPRPAPTTTTMASTTTSSAPAAGTPVVVVVPPPASSSGGAGGGPSFSDRVTTPGVVLLAQLGVVLLAAFLLAAAIQRVVLGKYAFKVGTVEVPEVESDIEGLEATLADVKRNATAKIAALAKRLNEIEQSLPPEGKE